MLWKCHGNVMLWKSEMLESCFHLKFNVKAVVRSDIMIFKGCKNWVFEILKTFHTKFRLWAKMYNLTFLQTFYWKLDIILYNIHDMTLWSESDKNVAVESHHLRQIYFAIWDKYIFCSLIFVVRRKKLFSTCRQECRSSWGQSRHRMDPIPE